MYVSIFWHVNLKSEIERHSSIVKQVAPSSDQILGTYLCHYINEKNSQIYLTHILLLCLLDLNWLSSPLIKVSEQLLEVFYGPYCYLISQYLLADLKMRESFKRSNIQIVLGIILISWWHKSSKVSHAK